MRKGMIYFLFLLLIFTLEGTLIAQEKKIVPGVVITKDNLDEYLPELEKLLPQPAQVTYLYGLRQGWITMPVKEYEPLPLSQFTKVGLANADKGFAVGKNNVFIGKWERGSPFPHPKTGAELAWSIFRRRTHRDGLKWPADFHLFTPKGKLERSFAWVLHKRWWSGRCYYDPMPEEPGNNMRLDSKESIIITKPFDVKGFCHLRIRYEGLEKDDDVYAYLPALRRIRRLTGSDLTDPLLGSDCIPDDFEIWRRKLNPKMTFKIGQGSFLQPIYVDDKSKPPYDPSEHYFCYQCDWVIRPMWVLTIFTNDPDYPTDKRVIWGEKDTGTFELRAGVSYDHKGRPYRATSFWLPASFKDEWGEIYGFWGYSWLNMLNHHHTVLDLGPTSEDAPYEVFTFKGLLRSSR